MNEKSLNTNIYILISIYPEKYNFHFNCTYKFCSFIS